MTEGWLALVAVVLLLLAAIARVLAFGGRSKWWALLSVALRLAAAVALAVALVLSILASGGWSPGAVVHVVLALTLAILCTHLLLVWRLGVDGASPVVDLLVLLLLLLGTWVFQSDASALACLENVPALYVQWILFLLGIGGAVVAGSAGLLLYVRALLGRSGQAGRLPPDSDMHLFLRQATAVALAALGSGLIVGVWWSWRATGSLYSGDPREILLASTWLVAGMSLLAWQGGERPALWAAGFSLSAAIVGLVGVWV